MFVGFARLGEVFTFPVLIVTPSTQVPVNSSTTPAFRVYGPAGLQTNGTGSLDFEETGVITNATNASPIVITSASHGLTTGMKVTVSGVLGNTAANGTFTITRLTADTFSLDGSTGNAPYTSGGVWKTTGLYFVSITPSEGDGYNQGGFYDVVVIANVSGTVAYSYRFGVI